MSPQRRRPEGAGVRATVDLSSEAMDELVQRVATILQPESQSDDGWLRGADRIAAYIDCKPDRVYALSSAGRIPVERDGSALIARKSDLDAWIRHGGGRRP
jgi:hypothetical protein